MSRASQLLSSLSESISNDAFQNAVKEFMKEANSAAGRSELGDTLDVVSDEPGMCAAVSEYFIDWIKRTDKDLAQHFKMITGEGNKKGWPIFADGDFHTAILVDQSTVLDFTARQFDKSLPYPRIISKSRFTSEWKKIS